MQNDTMTVWNIRPLARSRADSNKWTRRLADSLCRWVTFAESTYREWPERPRCGHFFGGAYWYELETSHTAAVYAVLAALPEPGMTSRHDADHLAERAIRAIRYMCYTHDTGPEACVRATSRNARCSGTKWGGRNDRYFMATQVGSSLSYFGLAAWLMWERLDDETRIMAQRVVSSYADRWSDVEPRNGTYFDTQLEENAWTGIGIFIAALLFPDHPHHDKWWQAYRKWNINTTTTFRDRLSGELSQGVPLKSRVSAITLHPDYTTENHAFVHPTYMAASMHFRGREIAGLLLAGLDVETAETHNDREMYERTLKRWAEADGIPTSVQGQDWWYNQQHAFLCVHALMNVQFRDGEAARLEELALDAIEALQRSNDRGCYLEQHGEACPIVPRDYQTAIDMEHLSAAHVLNAYLLHKLGGSGEKPAGETDLAGRLSGVREYPFGGFVIHRTATTFASFSWRNHVMALCLPRHGSWLQAPLYDSYTGTVRVTSGDGGATRNEAFVVEAIRHRVDVREDGFAAYALLERGDDRLLQHVGFVSLPDGRSVYWEQFEAKADVEIAAAETGAIGVRNERYSAMPGLAKGYRMLHMPGRSQRFDSWLPNGSDTLADYAACPYVNIDDEAGFLLYGSNGIRYHNRHVYEKWRGGEDRLTLNYRAVPFTLSAGERTAMFAVVSLPNHTAAQTAELAGRGRAGGGGSAASAANGTVPHTAVWHDGRYLVSFNCGTRPETVTLSEAKEGGAFPLYPGVNRIGDGRYVWSGVVPPGRSGYLACSGTVELVADAADELEISVAEEAVIFLNTGARPVAFLYARAGDGGRQERIELAPGAFYRQRSSEYEEGAHCCT